MYVWKSNICTNKSNKLDVQETDLGLTQLNISLDAGLRMDGIPALDLWDSVIEVFHSSPTQSKKTKDQARGNSSRDTTSNKQTQNQIEDPTKHNNLELSNVLYMVRCVSFLRTMKP